MICKTDAYVEKRVMMSSWVRQITVCVLCLLLGWGAFSEGPSPIQTVMEQVKARLQENYPVEKLLKLEQKDIDPFITPEQRQVLASRYWCFDVNVPVIVSVMRDTGQAVVPFWLTEAGFKKTPLLVRNDEYQYEVWQKAFEAGPVGLGINGFDKNRPHYFVAVGPQKPGDTVQLTNFFPADQQVFTLKKGSSVYLDWPDLLLTQIPAELQGQVLLPTIRGRAREAHLLGAFRTTEFPASDTPDQVVLTWSEDPSTTQTIQWRTKAPMDKGTVRYQEKNASEWKEAQATVQSFQDRLLVNEGEIRHFTAVLRDLKPGTEYTYTVGGTDESHRSAPKTFITAPNAPAPFDFVFLSDTHNSPVVGPLLEATLNQYPRTAFCIISGDLVGTGQYLEDWDELFGVGQAFWAQRPLMPSVGNHDAIDGLGSELFRGLLELPANGPKFMPAEQTYSFPYSNALFLLLDVTSPIQEQSEWIESQLRDSKATWKIAVLHFPPHAPDDHNPDILAAWIPLFEQYHVDFVLSGHVHHYLRTQPMKAGKVVESTRDGIVYFITVSVAGGPEKIPQPRYAAKFDCSGAALYTVFSFDGNRAEVSAHDLIGNTLDKAIFEK